MSDEKKYDISYVHLQGVSMYQTNLVHSDGKPAGEMRHVGLTLSWGANIGFGELYINDRGDRGVQIDAEGLSKDFVKAVLCKMVDDAELREFPRCSVCKKCRTTLRTGGYYCPSCEPKAEQEPIDPWETFSRRTVEAFEKNAERAREMVREQREGTSDVDWEAFVRRVIEQADALKEEEE